MPEIAERGVEFVALAIALCAVEGRIFGKLEIAFVNRDARLSTEAVAAAKSLRQARESLWGIAVLPGG